MSLEELVWHYRDRLTKAFNAIRPLVREGSYSHQEVENRCQEYRRFLEEQQVKQKIVVAPYPSVSHAEVVARIYDGKRPFHGERKEIGYKDYLIWRSVIEFSRADDRWDSTHVVFISENTNDFGAATRAEHPSLHKDLIEDFDKGADLDRVSYFQSVDSYAHAVLGDGFPDLVRERGDAADLLCKKSLPLILNKFLSTYRAERKYIKYEPQHLQFTIGHAARLDEGYFISGILEFTPYWHSPIDGQLLGDNLWDADVSLIVGRDLRVLRADVEGENVLFE